MAYYVTISIAGTMEEEGRFDTLAEAKAERDRLDAEAVAKGHEPGFWIILDEDGNRVDEKLEIRFEGGGGISSVSEGYVKNVDVREWRSERK